MVPMRKIAGVAVHVFTASGAVCGVLALHHAASQEWAAAFIWLGIAAVIDGLDGPIARWLDVEKTLPRFSGVRLDLVVDYLNYCVVPAFILMRSGLAGDTGGVVVAAVIVLSSLFHFADNESKTDDGYFVGFPAIWNVVVLYFFVFDCGAVITVTVTLFLAATTFVPLKWVHPIRVVRWRPTTVAVTLGWLAAAAYEVLENFPGILPTRVVLAAAAAYLMLVGLDRSIGLSRRV